MARTKIDVSLVNPVSAPLNMGGNAITNVGAPSGANDVATKSYVDTNGGVPSGSMVDFAGTSAPTGWTLCDGSAISRTTFATLFTAIGVTWGAGNGSTTFNVPDFRRRTSVGSGGSGTGTLGNAVGNTGGEETHTLTTAELAAHNHGVTDPGHNHSVNDPGHSHSFPFNQDSGDGTNRTRGCAGGVQANFSTNGASTGVSNNSNTTGISTQNNGSGTAHNVIQPSAIVMKIIKN